jgi:exodeoxyribonuclease VII large subunit
MPRSFFQESRRTILAIYTVTELNRRVREILVSEPSVRQVWVQGEISNLTKHSSGHYYFTLKDESSQVSCVSFRSVNRSLRFEPEKDMKVLVFGNIDLYAVRGQYQLQVLDMRPEGIGELYRAFEQLKKRLMSEGLFDPLHKRPLPAYPRRIGVATSPTGAAIHDIINVLSRRYPAVILLAPAIVQGEQAAESIVRALDMLNRAAVDVIITGRGGGSLEDLWAFNEEKVARAIYGSGAPVISAVGHETDYTIADFVADFRAPTPSAAAEIVAPDLGETHRRLGNLEDRLTVRINHRLENTRQQVMALGKHLDPAKLQRLHLQHCQHVDETEEKLYRSIRYRTEAQASAIAALAGRLHAVSPLNTLKRGYAIVRDERSNVITTAESLAPGKTVELLLADGSADCLVRDVKYSPTGK